jgi:hypothetical protein
MKAHNPNRHVFALSRVHPLHWCSNHPTLTAIGVSILVVLLFLALMKGVRTGINMDIF